MCTRRCHLTVSGFGSPRADILGMNVRVERKCKEAWDYHKCRVAAASLAHTDMERMIAFGH